MTRFTRLCRALGVGLAVTAATLSMTQVAHGALPAPDVPADIAVKAGNELFLVGHVLPGKGVQTYTCNAGKWGTSSVPTAELSDGQASPIIKHFAGPTWQELPNGSTVMATKVAAVPDPDGDGIPWLLLKATKKTAGRGGNLLAPTTFIQRLNTTGGLTPPAEDCTTDTPGKEVNVPYTADYYFYKETVGG